MGRHKHLVTTLAWSPTGIKLAIGFATGFVQVVNSKNGNLVSSRYPHIGSITSIAWSPDQEFFASVATDGRIQIFDGKTGNPTTSIYAGRGEINSITWLGTQKQIATAHENKRVVIWDLPQKPGESIVNSKTFISHTSAVNSLTYSHPTKTLASAGSDGVIKLWDLSSSTTTSNPINLKQDIKEITWSKSGELLAAALSDCTIRIINGKSHKIEAVLEGHTGTVTKVQFLDNDKALISYGIDHRIRLWRTDTWENVATICGATDALNPLAFAAHPTFNLIAISGVANDKTPQTKLFDIAIPELLKESQQFDTVYYSNAKVVLVGDSSVGKSGLALTLTGRQFTPTESTHGRKVWIFDTKELTYPDGRVEIRETLLWDLAGQPGYRLIHQLNLQEATVALIVFDSQSEISPMAGVRHWDRAIHVAHLLQGEAGFPLKKILTSARIDRGGVGISKSRIDSFINEYGFESFFETSAKEGWGISELRDAIQHAINWDALPRITSTRLFQRIKGFLLEQKRAGKILSRVDDLFLTFTSISKDLETPQSSKNDFVTCIRLVESKGFIRRLSFGNLLLLQPELLDSYASAIVNAAREEPDGLGCISEDDCIAGRFRMASDERINESDDEKLLIIAAIEDMLRHEIALREDVQDGRYLVFPSQLTRESPGTNNAPEEITLIKFQGPVTNIYATLAVRLSHSGVFQKKSLWRSAATYVTKTGNTCAIHLRELGEGAGEILLSFDNATSSETRQTFEGFVASHLERRSLPGSVLIIRPLICHSCQTPVTELQLKRRREAGFSFIKCSVCDARVILPIEIDGQSSNIDQIDNIEKEADSARDRETARSILEGKIATKDFDVFLAHNSADKEHVIRICSDLRKMGLNPWLDEEQIPPGRWFQEYIQGAITSVKSAAIIVGNHGLGKWQILELRSFISQCVTNNLPVIPVLLPGTKELPTELTFLSELNHVRFQKPDDRHAYGKLAWGITGQKPTWLGNEG